MLSPVMGCDGIDNGMAVLARGSHGNAYIKSRYVDVLRNSVPLSPDTLWGILRTYMDRCAGHISLMWGSW
jgi:hypothetical protein